MGGKGVDGMLTTNAARATAEAWLGDFGAAVASGDAARIAALFADELPLA
jgi:ketosteroid isomerase-like protein